MRQWNELFHNPCFYEFNCMNLLYMHLPCIALISSFVMCSLHFYIFVYHSSPHASFFWLTNTSSLLMFVFYSQVIYRIKLPGPAILGEGKPENQNHAIIFTRGEGLQTIDMNQVVNNLLILQIDLSFGAYHIHFCRITTWRRHWKWEICCKNFWSMMV